MLGWGACLAMSLVRVFTVTYVVLNMLLAAIGCLFVIGLGYGTIAVVCLAFGVQPRWLAGVIMQATLSLFCGHMQIFGGLHLSVHGDRMRSERALLVCNHRSWVDTAVLVSLARHANSIPGIRFVADRQLLTLPVFGILAALLDAVFLIERKAATASAPLSRAYRRLRAYAAARKPYWLVVYAEGFLRSAEKLAEARAFAESRGLTPLRHLLQPRTKGFAAALSALRPEIDAVYDINVAYGNRAYDDVTPSIHEISFDPAWGERRVVNVCIRRIPIDDVPLDMDRAKDWLYKLYEEKDEMLERFYQDGKFHQPKVPWTRISVASFIANLAKCIITFVVFITALVALTIKFRNPTYYVLPTLLAR